MLTSIANIHRHQLPNPGEIVNVNGLRSHGFNPSDRWIVESFPLSDSADQRYSRGIHTVTVRRLRDGRSARISGFYCAS